MKEKRFACLQDGKHLRLLPTFLVASWGLFDLTSFLCKLRIRNLWLNFERKFQHNRKTCVLYGHFDVKL